MRNVLWATFVIMTPKYDVRLGNRNMKFGVKAHHTIGSITSALSGWKLGSDASVGSEGINANYSSSTMGRRSGEYVGSVSSI